MLYPITQDDPYGRGPRLAGSSLGIAMPDGSFRPYPSWWQKPQSQLTEQEIQELVAFQRELSALNTSGQ